MKRSIVAGRALAAVGCALLCAPQQFAASQRDPFARKVVRKAPAKKVVEPSEVVPPPLRERLASCSSKGSTFGRSAANSPCPYLVSELKVNGVFEGASGPGAFVIAGPNGEKFMVEKGDRVFDGEVIDIREGSADELPSVVFKQISRKRLGKTITNTTREVRLEVAR